MIYEICVIYMLFFLEGCVNDTKRCYKVVSELFLTLLTCEYAFIVCP